MTKDLSPVPQILRPRANGLEHRVLEWTDGTSDDPRSARRHTTVLLLHGYMDAAGTWDLVAPTLARAGFRVLAPDMRGFGDGARAPRGSYYHFPDYVADVAALVAALAADAPLALVGPSMGGVVATLFAGAFPEKVAAVANLEGLGPPARPLRPGRSGCVRGSSSSRRSRREARRRPCRARRRGAASG